MFRATKNPSFPNTDTSELEKTEQMIHHIDGKSLNLTVVSWVCLSKSVVVSRLRYLNKATSWTRFWNLETRPNASRVVKQIKKPGTRQEGTYSSSSLLSTLFRSSAVNPDAGSKFTTSRNMGLGVVFWI